MKRNTRHPDDADRPEHGVDGVLAASKALVGVAARSLAALEDDDITLSQFRALLLVDEGRASAPGDLAELLEVHPSNATRLVDRMVAKGLVERSASTDDRRVVSLEATVAGRRIVADVLDRRRRAIEEVLADLPPGEADAIGAALGRFATAAGEATAVPSDEAWRLGWGS